MLHPVLNTPVGNEISIFSIPEEQRVLGVRPCPRKLVHIAI